VFPDFILLFLIIAVPLFQSYGQSKEALKQRGESQLSRMTADEIDRKIKELGLTREEAVRRAAELGIPLEQYLGSLKAPERGRLEELEIPVKDTITTDLQRMVEQDSLLRTERTRKKTVSLSPIGLPYFGYDVFLNVPDAFDPSASGPVDPEYVVGADDALKVSVWGQVEFQNELRVDKEGRIFVPTVGQVLVTGLTLQEVYDKLLKQMSRSYSGLVSKPPSVWLDVTVARVRPKRVFIVGEVEAPGGYTLSSHATVFNALYSVGGPTVKGSLRDVRVTRGNTVIARVDLYDYLAGAEKTNDIRVQNNDIIFIPPRGKTISIEGEVRRPAVYELKESEGLAELLRFCGGVLPSAYDGNAQVDRIRPWQQRDQNIENKEVVDIKLRDLLADPKKPVSLFDGDEVRVFPVLDEKWNYVVILGPVWRPGRYELGEVKTIRGLISAARGLQPKTYQDLGHLIRYNPDLLTRKIIPFNLKKVLESSVGDQPLMQRDTIILYSTEMLEVKDRFVTIRGSVKKPGRQPLRTGMAITDLIPLAGGYTEDAELLQAEVSRITPEGLQGDSLAIILHPTLPRSFDPDSQDSNAFLLQHRDEVLIKPNPFYKKQQDVTIAGDVNYPGIYSIQRRGERLSEMLARAGGPTTTTFMGGAQFYRNKKRVLLDFNAAFTEKNILHDVVMLGGDSIYIPSTPHTVLVTGEVNNPGLLSFIDGNDVTSYIDRAGGLTDSSKYAVLIKPTGESRRVDFGWFSSDPEVPEGSQIHVIKVPPPASEVASVDIGETVKDVFAILTSAATLAFIIWQVSR